MGFLQRVRGFWHFFKSNILLGAFDPKEAPYLKSWYVYNSVRFNDTEMEKGFAVYKKVNRTYWYAWVILIGFVHFIFQAYMEFSSKFARTTSNRTHIDFYIQIAC